MSDRAAVTQSQLTLKQYLFLIRKLGGFSKRTVLDVSSKGDEIAEVIRRGGSVQGIIDHAEGEVTDVVSVGSPSGSLSTPAHSVRHILLRDSLVFANENVTPETTIALANLLSCLEKRGKLVIPITGEIDSNHALWQSRLSGFPGKLIQRELKTGLVSYMNLTFLLRGVHSIPVLEFTIGRKLISRLEWHRIAREAVMERMKLENAAA